MPQSAQVIPFPNKQPIRLEYIERRSTAATSLAICATVAFVIAAALWVYLP
jgi:hypothetical protein